MSKYLQKWPFLALIATIQLASWPVISAEWGWQGYLGLLIITGLALAPLMNPDKRIKDMMKNPWLTVGVGTVWAVWLAWQNVMVGLEGALAFAFVVLVLRKGGLAWGAMNGWILCIFSSLMVWSVAGGGAHYAVAGLLAFGLVTMLGYPRLNEWLVIVFAILLGGLAGSEILLVGLPVVVGGSLLAVWPQRAIKVAGISAFCAGVGMGYLGMPEPVWAFSGEAGIFAGIVVVLVMILMIYNWRWWAPTLQLGWWLGTLGLLVSMADVAENSHFSAVWAMAMPVVAFALLAKIGHENRVRHL